MMGGTYLLSCVDLQSPISARSGLTNVISCNPTND